MSPVNAGPARTTPQVPEQYASSHPVPADLVRQLEPVAARVRVLGGRLLRVAAKMTREELTEADIRHHALAVSFEAFLALGGDPCRPGQFDWPGRRQELEKEALRQLKQETMRRQTVFADIVNRTATRKNVACVESYRWDAWSFVTAKHSIALAGFGSPNDSSIEYVAPAAQEQQFVDEQLDGLVAIVHAVLDPQDAAWLLERLRDEVPQAVQIDRLVAAEPEKYAGAAGRRRAENFIAKRISRARERLAAHLGESWGELAREIAA